MVGVLHTTVVSITFGLMSYRFARRMPSSFLRQDTSAATSAVDKRCFTIVLVAFVARV